LSPFFSIMHLPQLPTIFVKDGEERKAYHTVEAKELVAAGWVEKGAKPAPVKTAAKTAPKVETPKAEAVKAKPEAPKPVIKEDAK
jgi:hypothetical protein